MSCPSKGSIPHDFLLVFPVRAKNKGLLSGTLYGVSGALYGDLRILGLLSGALYGVSGALYGDLRILGLLSGALYGVSVSGALFRILVYPLVNVVFGTHLDSNPGLLFVLRYTMQSRRIAHTLSRSWSQYLEVIGLSSYLCNRLTRGKRYEASKGNYNYT